MRYILPTILLLFLSSPSLSDTWGEYMHRRIVDPTGRYYVVIRKTDGWQDHPALGDPGRGGPVIFTIAEANGNDKVTSASDKFDYSHALVLKVKDPNVKVRDGDRIHGNGRLQRAPLYVRVSSTGLGFVTLDVHGYNYSDVRTKNALIHVSLNGKIHWKKAWKDLFDKKETLLFSGSAGGTCWVEDAWINEIHREVVIVGRAFESEDHAIMDRENKKRYLYRSISLDTGKVKHANTEVIIDALKQQNMGALSVAIRLSAKIGLVSAKKHLLVITKNKKIPKKTRKLAHSAISKIENK